MISLASPRALLSTIRLTKAAFGRPEGVGKLLVWQINTGLLKPFGGVEVVRDEYVAEARHLQISVIAVVAGGIIVKKCVSGGVGASRGTWSARGCGSQ